jgi:DNA-binding response OmpR family regulator
MSETSTSEATTDRQGLTAVVVSDDIHLRAEVEYGFPSNVEVVVVDDARGAYELMRQTRPDVAVVDLQMGNAGGYGLRRDMLADDRLRDVPVLMLIERPQDKWLAEQAGATQIAIKPVEVAELAQHALHLAAPRL